jgi:predicted aspartyl protease
MSTPFNATQGLIVVIVRIEGPTGHAYPRLALDTGATATMINSAQLVGIGYDPATVPQRVQMTTGSGVEFVPRLGIAKLEALGQTRTSFEIVAHTLPPSASVDGLLGLDFLRGQVLTIDFRTGQIALA